MLSSMTGYGQHLISGKILDQDNKSIANVSITYKKPGTVAILGFSRSDEQGAFTLRVSSAVEVDSLELDFNHLGYAKKSILVANKAASYTVELRQEFRQIEEVKVSDLPIFKRKDTVNFNVDAFASKQDRVIADIIKKLPGIEMQGDQILYQGKPIQKYMVNNLDLMEGRYAMINNNLPADAVKKVQVVENDQPIKILDSLVFSDRASLNLELKKFTTTGAGKVGVGAMPALWDVNLTPMVFGKTFQMLSSFQSNNIGYDASKDLRAFYTGGSFFNAQFEVEDAPSYIFLRQVNTPGFDERKWNDNKLFLWSTNTLKKLKNGMELKGSVSYYDDMRFRRGFTSTQYFTSDKTILNTEAIDNRYRINVFDAGLLLEKNEKNVYLRNSTKYHKRWNNDLGNVLFNGENPILQRRAYTDETLMNSLAMARFIGKQLVNIRSLIAWHNTPQRLIVSPGQFAETLNDGVNFASLGQQVQYGSLQWKNGMGFTRGFGKWRFSPDFSLNYDRKILDTYITLQDNGRETLVVGEYVNAMRNSLLQLGMRLGIAWESIKWKFLLNTPYSVNYYNIDQQGEELMNRTFRSTLMPAATLTYLSSGNNEWGLSLSGGNEFAGMDNFYNGYIISQYRSMQRYETRLLGTKNVRSAISYRYKNTLKANFANVTYSYAAGFNDYIFKTQLDELSRTTTEIADRHSANDSHSLSAGISRFFVKAKMVAKLNGIVEVFTADYLLNELMARQKSINYGFRLELINNWSSFVTADYKVDFNQRITTLAEGMQNKVLYNNHYFNLAFYPGKKHTFFFQNAYYGNNIPGQTDQFFLDATYRFRVQKWKTDLELMGNNLLNNNNYVQQLSTNFELVQSYFELRPRQFLLSIRFKF